MQKTMKKNRCLKRFNSKGECILEKTISVRNEKCQRVFDLVREKDALYLDVKCSDNKNYNKIVRIKLSDMLYQIWQAMKYKERKGICEKIELWMKESASNI